MASGACHARAGRAARVARLAQGSLVLLSLSLSVCDTINNLLNKNALSAQTKQFMYLSWAPFPLQWHPSPLHPPYAPADAAATSVERKIETEARIFD